MGLFFSSFSRSANTVARPLEPGSDLEAVKVWKSTGKMVISARKQGKIWENLIHIYICIYIYINIHNYIYTYIIISLLDPYDSSTHHPFFEDWPGSCVWPYFIHGGSSCFFLSKTDWWRIGIHILHIYTYMCIVCTDACGWKIAPLV